MTVEDFTDKAAIFRKLSAMPDNKVCFDCNAENPTWTDLYYGAFICNECAEIHKNYGISICFVRSIYFNSWLPEQLYLMSIGGNEPARVFFKQHGWTGGGDLEAKYTSEAAKLYSKFILGEVGSFISKEKLEPPSSLSRHATNELLDVNVIEDLEECTPETDAIYPFTKASPEKVSTSSVKNLKGASVTRRTAGFGAQKLISKILETDVARRKFPNAKSISSSQFLEDQENMDHQKIE